jgi:hypothetical protein
MADFEVRRDDLRTTRTVEGEPPGEAGEGELVLRVDRFGLTANNVTYGVFGDVLSYWDFFPASEEGWGRVPVWGYGDVESSGVEGIEPGERFYGYLPMSSRLTVEARAAGAGFNEVSERRADLPGVYNRYVRVQPGEPLEDEQLILRPLFGTSFLLEDFLRTSDYFEADAIALSSASSKTAYGLAFLLSRDEDAPRVIGLTSERNREFVESLGVYGQTVTYDDIAGALDADEALVYVDLSGDAEVRAAVHRTAAGRLKHSCAVGLTHWEDVDGPSDLPGPAPEFFFAPTHIDRLTKDIGGAELQRRMGEAWAAFAGRLEGWMEVERLGGAHELERAWLALVEGAADPRRAPVVSL